MISFLLEIKNEWDLHTKNCRKGGVDSFFRGYSQKELSNHCICTVHANYSKKMTDTDLYIIYRRTRTKAEKWRFIWPCRLADEVFSVHSDCRASIMPACLRTCQRSLKVIANVSTWRMHDTRLNFFEVALHWTDQVTSILVICEGLTSSIKEADDSKKDDINNIIYSNSSEKQKYRIGKWLNCANVEVQLSWCWVHNDLVLLDIR